VTDLDDRVRTLLEARAHDVAVDPTMPRTVAVRSRRRRAVAGAVVGLGAVAALVAGAAALQTALPERRTGGTPTLTPSPAPAAPATFVGVRDGQILLVDAASGEPIRVLVDRAGLGGGSGALDLELSPDGSTLYYVANGMPELIMRVPIAGGEPTLVAQGRKPTVSPDGGRLAYVDCHSPMAGCGNAIVILDLGTGDTRSWNVRADEWVGQLAWLPDGRTLAFSMFYPGDSNPTTHLLDTMEEAGAALSDVGKIGPERVGAGWTVIGYHQPTAGLAVLHYCCSSNATDEIEETALLSVGQDGRMIETLLDRADWSDVELDATGRYLLLVDLGRDVYRLDAGGEPVLVAGGFEHVDW
jgi:hypothetical protein